MSTAVSISSSAICAFPLWLSDAKDRRSRKDRQHDEALKVNKDGRHDEATAITDFGETGVSRARHNYTRKIPHTLYYLSA